MMKLLADKPQSGKTNKSVDFAYDDLTKSIIQLIEASPRPFTIGLFGKWGTGKSTIIETLRHKLDKRQYVFVKFDVWKYESDALRRSFLIDLAQQLKGKTPFAKIDEKYIERLRRKLYTSTQRSEEKFKLSWRSLVVPLAIIIVVGIVYLLSKRPIAAAISGALGFMAIDTLKNYFLDKSHFTQQISIGEDKINSPEEFYAEFKNILNQTKKKTFVIVIDNLDRTQKEKTVELLSTVKTFLNADDTNDNVVFIIASDDKAIKEHITATYAGEANNGTRFDANEFLKKFFNVVVEIPVFIESEIGKYTSKLLNKLEVEEFKGNTDLQQIINYAYNENPREIKQYVNNLAAFNLLLVQGVPGNGLTEKFVAENLNFICKLLIVRDRFNNVFELMKKLAIDNSLTWSEIEQRLRSKEELDIPKLERDEYVAFSNLTSWCSPTDESIAWFFRLRRSSEDLALPGWDLFVNAALQQDYENAQKLFQDFGDLNALNNQLTTFIGSIRNDPVRSTPFFSVYMRILLTLDETKLDELKGSIDLAFLHAPNAAELLKVISLIDLSSAVQRLGTYARTSSLNELIKSLKRMLEQSTKGVAHIAESDLIKIIDAVDVNETTLAGLKPVVRAEIQQNHSTEATLNALKAKKQSLRDELVSTDTLRNFFKHIDTNEVRAIQQYDLLAHFNIGTIISLYFETLYNIASQINARGVVEEKKEIIGITYQTLVEQEAALQSLTDTGADYLSRVCEMFGGWYGEQPTDADRATLVLLLSLLAKVPKNTASNFAVDRLTKLVTQGNINEVVKILGNERVSNIVPEAQTVLRDRMATYPDQVEALLPYIEPAHLPYVISHMSQKAIDTSDESVYRNQLELDHKLYPKVADADKATASQHIYNALNSGINRFPDAVKAYWEKRFITVDQRRELKRLMSEYEATLTSNEE